MDDLLNDFLVETSEHIEAAGEQLVLFERDPTDREAIIRIFRLFHTIKGTCGFLGLSRLEHLTHVTESLISKLRDGAPATAETVSLTLAAVDRVKNIVAGLAETGKEPEGDEDDLTFALQAHACTSASPQAPEEAAPPPAAAKPGKVQLDKAQSAPRENPAPAVHAPAQARPETIRVSVGALERIMLLVSELVLTRNQLLELTRHQDDAVIKTPLQRLSSLTTDLQDAVMRARMQSVGRLFASLPRLVRELAVDLKKKLHLVTEGADTELDRQLIELIRDPLTHLLRNCADHGIETPQERIALGKSEEGTIRVTATHEAGYITIDVSDDGRGLDLQKIREKAIVKGLVSANEAKELSDEDVGRFIFAPDFSTARAVTSISGRGVGMDIVRDNIESIGGSISLTTVPGKGTRFTLKIPLTLAITPALIVEACGHRFALPQHSVVEAVGLDEAGAHKLEDLQGSLVLRLREEILPVVALGSILEIDPGSRAASGDLVIVMRVNNRAFGVLVDAVTDVQEIVVKPLGSSLSELEVFSGHTILGDGSVVLILDPTGIAGRMGFERANDYTAGRVVENFTPTDETTRFVLFRAGSGAPKALPLSLIVRIESIPAADIRMSDGLMVVQHQSHLMPLVPLYSTAETRLQATNPVLVLGIGGESMGLLIEQIVDVVEARLTIEIASTSPGVIGTAEIRGEIAEVLDATYFMQIGRPNAYSRGVANQFRVLLVDDKPFFRDMLAPLIIAAGYRVNTAASAAEALAMFEKGAHFDAVVTDTDMPQMSGYELARRLTREPRHRDLPIVALAAHAAPTVLQAARESGMCGAVGKFDRAALVKMLGDILEVRQLNKHDLEKTVIGSAAA
ncbi:MAG: hybrid sensor histidine kinase/response regulator [Methylovirgula sp.]|nr:hybrid sensor histidine kinase/response regulator [Methylovirgula sp.]